MELVYLIFVSAGLTLVVSLVFSAIRNLFSPLRSIPGPFVARFTDGWYLWRVSRGYFEKDNLALHAKYGENYFWLPLSTFVSNTVNAITRPCREVWAQPIQYQRHRSLKDYLRSWITVSQIIVVQYLGEPGCLDYLWRPVYTPTRTEPQAVPAHLLHDESRDIRAVCRPSFRFVPTTSK
jgi:hypothetical protein